MKIRIMGTKEECRAMQTRFETLKEFNNVKSMSISGLYANRNSRNVCRLYVEIEFKDLELAGELKDV